MGDIIGLIPARGGSKGIPRKNIVNVAGKELITYVIEAAHLVRELDGLYVTTEDAEIGKIVNKLGVNIIDRPKELSLDNTPSLPFMQHAIAEIEANGVIVDWVVLLQPTYPFIQPQRIGQVIETCHKTKADSVTTLVQATNSNHPYNARKLLLDGSVSFLFPEIKAKILNRQSAPPMYYFGNIVASRKETLLAGSIYGESSECISIEFWESLDIDDYFDLTICSLLIEHWGGTKNPNIKF